MGGHTLLYAAIKILIRIVYIVATEFNVLFRLSFATLTRAKMATNLYNLRYKTVFANPTKLFTFLLDHLAL